jgi:hypothetical protein
MLQNGEVMIITDDVIFARMLVLELAKVKINASVSLSAETPRNFKGLYIADADYISEKLNERLTSDYEKDVILFLYHLPETAGNQRNAIWMCRLFIMEDFTAAVADMLVVESNIPREDTVIQTVHNELSLKGNGSVSFCGKNILLTRREYELLEYLYKNCGRAVSRNEAVTSVWNYEFIGNTNVVDVYIRYLREKIDENVGVKLIYTVRNKGYMIK